MSGKSFDDLTMANGKLNSTWHWVDLFLRVWWVFFPMTIIQNICAFHTHCISHNLQHSIETYLFSNQNFLDFRMVKPSVFLVGNKQDLCHMREVGWDEGQKLAIDNKCQFCELSAAEHYQEVVAMFTKVLRHITSNFKVKEKRRPSGSKSMAKLINNMFGKRRKSV